MNEKRNGQLGKKIAIFIAGALVSFVGAYVFFIQVSDYVLVPRDEIEEIQGIFNDNSKYYEIQNIIDSKSIYELDDTEYTDSICAAMIDNLNDDYARYYTVEEYEEWKESLNSYYTGIGITYTLNEDEYEVLEIFEGGPAEKAGMEIGDTIVSVDGETYDDINIMSQHIMGESGTEVTLTIVRKGETFEITMIREKIDTNSVEWEILGDGTGYIRIISFGLDTAEEFDDAMQELKSQNVEEMVIDLRNNPGGLVSACLDITDMLLPECTMLITKDKEDNKEVYNSDTRATDLEYVVLVNQNSASASEIMSAAIQDNDGGEIIGTQTFGKGVVQENVELSDGSAVKLTTMEYFSPDGDVIDKIGINPDVVVSYDGNTSNDEQLEKALEILAK